MRPKPEHRSSSKRDVQETDHPTDTEERASPTTPISETMAQSTEDEEVREENVAANDQQKDAEQVGEVRRT